jgi:1,2-diacylglycerol 3-alpha-glucosyltransferase
MQVLHVCFCGPFTDDLAYQENELIKQHTALGHDVRVIAATSTYGLNKDVVHLSPETSTLKCGAVLTRLSYMWPFRGWLATKIRAHYGFNKHLELIRPDVILFHGLTAWDLLTVAAYVRRHPEVNLFVDCHEDFNNSAKSWLSRELLHKLFYRPIFRRALPSIREVLCVTVESLEFATDFYGSPKVKTSLYPLGCLIEDDSVLESRRQEFRCKYGLSDYDIVFTQTGKLDKSKRLYAALTAFKVNKSSRLHFFIAGQMTNDVREECLPLIQSDNRIVYLGWQSVDELRVILAGSDLFIQPFGQTVTTQMAMASACATIAQDLPSHQWLLHGSGKLFKDEEEFCFIFQWALNDSHEIPKMKKAALEFARKYLDYKNLAIKILE